MRCSFRTHPFSWVQFPGFAPWAGMHCPLQRRQPTVSDQCWTGKLTSRWPGTLAPVSTLGPQATSLKTMAPKPLLRIRSYAKKTFGEAFGAATGVSDPRLQKIRIQNNNPGGKAATVAGYAGPGFHTWPPGHIPQDTDPNPLLRSRPLAKKTFGEAFGAATGVSDPRLQKILIQNRCAGGTPPL